MGAQALTAAWAACWAFCASYLGLDSASLEMSCVPPAMGVNKSGCAARVGADVLSLPKGVSFLPSFCSPVLQGRPFLLPNHFFLIFLFHFLNTTTLITRY